MKLKHRCSVYDCNKCGKVDYGRIYFCKVHNPQKYFRFNEDKEELIYELKNGKCISIKNDS